MDSNSLGPSFLERLSSFLVREPEDCEKLICEHNSCSCRTRRQYAVKTSLDFDHAMTAIRDAGITILEAARATAGAAGVEAEIVLLETMERCVSDILVEKARELGCDPIVIGRHGQRGLVALLFLGSVAGRVARLPNASVLLVGKH